MDAEGWRQRAEYLRTLSKKESDDELRELAAYLARAFDAKAEALEDREDY
jgi:hypothetical protein